MEEEGTKHPPLVLVPSHLQGHLTPMLQLAEILYSEGFSITIAHTKYDSPNPSNYPQFNFLTIPDNLSDQEFSSADKISIVLLLNASCQSPFQDCLSNLIQQEKEGGISCIIYDEISYFAADAAYNLNIPSIIFRTSNAITSLVRCSAPFQLRAQGHIPLPDPTSLEPAPEHPLLRLKDLPISNFGSVQNFFKLVAKAINTRRSKAIIYNTMNCLEESSLSELKEHCQVPIFAIGPIHKIVPVSPSSSLLEEDRSCISWLDKQTINSVIYIGTGSLASMTEKDLAEMAWGLANSKQPFLWAIRPGSVHDLQWIEALPEGFKANVGERGRIVKWAPQKEVLAHEAVGGFWSHCGWNSTLESISEGVPLICRPSFGDQKVTARFVSDVWKVSLQLENELERGEIERVVKRLMVDEEGEEIRHRAMKLKKKTELAIREGGSSYNALKDLVEFIRSFSSLNKKNIY